MAWPWNLGYVLFNVIENCTIRKLWYGFVFAFHSDYAIYLAVSTHLHERDGQTPHDGIGRAYACMALQKNGLPDVQVTGRTDNKVQCYIGCTCPPPRATPEAISFKMEYCWGWAGASDVIASDVTRGTPMSAAAVRRHHPYCPLYIGVRMSSADAAQLPGLEQLTLL